MKKTFDALCKLFLNEISNNPTSTANPSGSTGGLTGSSLNKPTQTPPKNNTASTTTPTNQTKLTPQELASILTQAQNDTNLHKALQGVLDEIEKTKKQKATTDELAQQAETNAANQQAK